MPISIPIDSVYYYEVTSKSTRLLLWLPYSDLEKQVKKGNTSLYLLIDYPDGIDLEVSGYEFYEMKQRYNLVVGVNPNHIWYAFHAIWLKMTKVKMPCSGYIEKFF
jgi:hypothetical protein